MDLRNKNLTIGLALAAVCLSLSCLAAAAADSSPSVPVLSSRAAFLRAQRASRQAQLAQQAQQNQTISTNNQTSSTTNSAPGAAASTPSSTTSTTTSTSTTSAPSTSAAPSRSASSVLPASSSTSRPRLPSSLLIASGKPKEETAVSRFSSQQQQQQQQQHANRTTRTADVFQSGEGYNIFVTNTCEREQMNVKISMSKEFNGVIHTRNQRHKSICTIEGNGETEYNLAISHILNPADPKYCGVIKARRESPEDKDLLSVVIAVRFHRSIELSDDKFFLLNCTNRCRKSDCSEPSSRLREEPSENSREERINGRLGDAADRKPGEGNEQDECNIYKFPWLITLLWCMGIALAALIISHCIMCSSLVCRCVKTEVEEREPSVYEDDETDDEDKLYNRKNHPMRIDYDNRDIYKTSNNYEPYSLDEAQAEQRRARKSKSSQRR